MSSFVNEKYNAMIIEPNVDARMRLKTATTSVHQFKQVLQVTTLADSISRLSGGPESWDVFFISHAFSQEEQQGFIKKIKDTPVSQDCAAILLSKPDAQSATATAMAMLIGADGILFEPYSVDQLIEITRIASRIKKERAEAREKVAVKVLIAELGDMIDKIACGMALQVDMSQSMRKLKEGAQRIRNFSAQSMNSYFDVVVEVFENAKLPVIDPSIKKYSGASSRVKARTDKKLAEKLAAEQAASAATEAEKN